MLDRLISLLVAICMALLVWLYARSRDQEILDNVPIPVQVALVPSQADQYQFELAGPPQVLASFTGPPSRIRELRGILQRGELRIEMSLTVPDERQAESRYYETLRIEAADVHAPPGVTPIVLEGRNRIPVILHKLVERPVPVRVEPALTASGGAVEIDPPTVQVRGPLEVLERTPAIATQPVSIPLRSEGASNRTVVMQAALIQNLEGRPIRTTPEQVTIRITQQPRQTFELADVPIHFLCPANYPLRPKFFDDRGGRITLRIVGPPQEELPKVYAFVDLTRVRLSAGLHDEPLQVQLPKDFQLAQELPTRVPFQLEPAESTLRRVP
jgi:hypothetical protein